MNSLSLRLTFGLFLTLLGSLINQEIGRSQIIPDHSLGAESSRTRPDTIKNTPSDVIEGGATRGSHLFHSFREFNVNEGRGAYFANPDVIQNIFSRVTGGNISQIMGTLGVLGNANLFLINPSGIIFGPNARLDMRGAFIGATADSIVFDNNFEFSATNPNAPPLLTVNIPLGLRFRETSADINSTANLATEGNLTLKAENLNLSGTLVTGGDLTLEALNTLTIRDSVVSPFIAASGGNLVLQGNQSIDIYALNHHQSGIIAGGNLTLRSTNAVSGDAHYWSGGNFRIEKLDGSLGGLVSLYDPIIRTVGDVLISAYEGASLHIIAGGKVEIPSYILITGADAQFGLQETITLSNGQQITIDGKNNPTVDIRAGVSPEFIGTPFVVESGLDFFGDPTDFSATPTSADINVGTIIFSTNPQDINAKITGDVLLTNQYQPNPNLQGSIISQTSQQGYGAIETGSVDNGGRVTIDSRANINLTGVINSQSLNLGGNVLLNSIGDTLITSGTIGVTGSQGGSININANNINLSGNSRLIAGIGQGLGFENAQGGNITLNALQDISLDSSFIFNSVQQQAIGNLGDIIINTSNLTLNGSWFFSNTFGTGDAGAILITATDQFKMTGESSFLGESGLFSQVGLADNGVRGIGNSRGIVINTATLTLENGANIDSSTFGTGNAGVIQINATDSINIIGGTSQRDVVNQSGITSQVGEVGVGNSGGIVINTSNLTLQDGGRIDASTLGKGNAGPVSITANDSIKLIGESSAGQISQISSRVKVGIDGEGNSGGININTSTLTLEKGGSIDASTLGKGDAGVISITATDSINIIGESSQIGDKIVSGIYSEVNSQVNEDGIEQGIGNSNGIIIDTSTLTIQDGGRISASTFALGSAGNIQIRATDSITLTDKSLDGFGSNISSQVRRQAQGNSGDIIIDTSILDLKNGGFITTNTEGLGNAGAIKITANESISFSKTNDLSQGFSGFITSQVSPEGQGNSGAITIDTSILSLDKGGIIDASTLGAGNAGAIKITASDRISALGESSPGFLISSGIYSRVESIGKGNAGGIEIATGSLSLANGASIDSTTFGKGDAGVVKITAHDYISITGKNSLGLGSGISSQVVVEQAEGNAGGIEITTDSLFINDGGVVNASTFGKGNAGAVKITAHDHISITGENSLGLISGISSRVESTGKGNSGGIEITTGSLSLANGASVNASTFGVGDAGAIKITASSSISAMGESSQGFVSGIFSTVGLHPVRGNAGEIEINTSSLSLANGSNIAASTFGVGDAGAIKITASDSISAVGKSNRGFLSGIFSGVASTAEGNSGEIEITTGSLFLSDGATINARTDGKGNAGNILIKGANSITALRGSQLTTVTSSQGNAGSVTIDAPNAVISFDGVAISDNEQTRSGIFTIVQPVEGLTNARFGGDINITAKSLAVTNGAQINAQTSGLGNAGNVTINIQEGIALNGDFSRILTQVNLGAIGKGGDIILTAGSLSLTDGGGIASDTFGIGDAGNINLNVRDQIILQDFVTIPTDFGILPLSSSVATGVQVGGIGNAGTITIKAQSLSLDNFSLITTATSGKGNAANISIQVDEALTLTNLSTIESLVAAGAIGNSGNIDLKARSLTLTNGSQIETQLSRESLEFNLSGGVGKAGNININTTDFVKISGVSQVQLPINFSTEGFSSGLFASSERGASGDGGTITLTTNALYLADGAVINTLSANSGKAGDINIDANTFSSTGGGQVIAITKSSGNAGTITLNVTDHILLSGSDPSFSERLARFGEDIVNNQGAESGLFAQTQDQGIAGSININAPVFNIADSAVVSARTSGSGKGGSITVNSPLDITLGEKSQLNVETSGAGQAGNIEITSNTVTIGKDAQISATATKDATNTSGGGSININASNLNIAGQLGIFAETSGIAPAGTLKLTPDNANPNLNILFIEQGLISASTTASGNGGDINISAPNNIDVSGNGTIATTTSGSGNAGTINFNTNQLNLVSGVTVTASTTIGTGNAGNINLNATQINLEQATVNAFTDGGGNAGSIFVPNAQTINLTNSTISTEIQAQGVATEASNINLTSNTLNLDNSSITASTAGTGNAGEITLTNQQLVLNNSNITAISTGNGNAGSITLPNTQNLNLNQSQISVSTTKEGNAGSITVPTAQTINLNQSQITASTSGVGDTGTIELTGTEQIALTDNSEISNAVLENGIGNAQTITFNTPNLSLQNSSISSSTDGTGNAGSITVPKAQTITLDNSIISTEIQRQGTTTEPSNINLQTQQLTLDNNSQITATTSGDGDAGTITITADSLRATNRSSIQTNTTSSGIAGDMIFIVQDNLTLTDSTIEASTSPNSTGNGGSIRIDPRTVNLNNNARISVNSQGTGDGGNLSLEAGSLNLRNNSEISATTASGEGGNITLNVKDTVTQRNNSPISATAGGTGNGGNITMNTRFLVGNENSNITANAFEGRGGNINITADGIFRGSNSPITASSQLGVDGVVQTNTPEVDPSRGLLNLPQNPVDPNALISQNACRRGGQSEFTVTGRGGLPNTPEQVQRSNEVEVGLVEATQQTATSKPKKEILATRKIIPAQGWQRNDKGEMVLVATPTTDNAHRQTTMTDTCTSN